MSNCMTCRKIATETITEGMAEVIMDDQDVDYDVAVKRIDPAALAEQVDEYLTNDNMVRNGSCSMLHGSWY